MKRLLFKNRLRHHVVQDGQIECRRCQSKQPCKHVRTVLTSFLFGVIPTKQVVPVGEVIVCGSCEDHFSPESYSYNPSTGLFELMLWDCPYCRHSNPSTRIRCVKCFQTL
ncbi:MAG: hypothetical protein RLZZ142_1498 [Verrucomicrobiota bacterium]|jgi:uncharacterized CHY-type Zn-finger protein